MDSEKFGNLIKELRKKKNITQKELGEILHITDKAISKWERGLSIPDVTMLNKLADVFEISVEELINGEIGNEKEVNIEKVFEDSKKSKLKRNIITGIIITIILILAVIFALTIGEEKEINYDTDPDFMENLSVIGNRIAEPDRIVYRNENGEYVEFEKDTEEYKKIEAIIGNSIKTFKEYGQPVTQEELDEIHSKSFVEFDYDTISKNYCIPLNKEDNSVVIKLADTGGNVFSDNIENINKIKQALEDLARGNKKYELTYKEEISKNTFEEIEYNKIENFKEISYNGIYQAKIDNIEEYNEYKEIFQISIDEEITEKTFENNMIILTLSRLPEINVQVNVGNIKYTYDKLNDTNYNYNIHVLVVSKIVNTDCIYNTALSEIELKTENNIQAENKEFFVTDFEKFIEEYNNSTSRITLEEASEIAEVGFKEAERICGAFEKSKQISKIETVSPNNLFTRKENEMDKNYDGNIEVYTFVRTDNMDLNGVEIYVDVRLGKIIGGRCFGD